MMGIQNLAVLGAGPFVGVLFTWLRLPLPARPTLTGIVGEAGVFPGSVLFRWIVPGWIVMPS